MILIQIALFYYSVKNAYCDKNKVDILLYYAIFTYQ